MGATEASSAPKMATRRTRDEGLTGRAPAVLTLWARKALNRSLQRGARPHRKTLTAIPAPARPCSAARDRTFFLATYHSMLQIIQAPRDALDKVGVIARIGGTLISKRRDKLL